MVGLRSGSSVRNSPEPNNSLLAKSMMRFPVTFWRDELFTIKEERRLTIDELAKLTSLPASGHRLKLSTYGSGNQCGNGVFANSLCYESNVEIIHGIEIDYDGGEIPFEDAVSRMEERGILSLLHTTKSHTPSSPHWRILLPTSSPITRERRSQLCDRVSEMFNGKIAAESWSLWLSYHYERCGNHWKSRTIVGSPLS